jgi:hypothetical protein
VWKLASISRDQPSQRSAASIPAQNHALYGVLGGTLATPFTPSPVRIEFIDGVLPSGDYPRTKRLSNVEGDAPRRST